MIKYYARIPCAAKSIGRPGYYILNFKKAKYEVTPICNSQSSGKTLYSLLKWVDPTQLLCDLREVLKFQAFTLFHTTQIQTCL